MRKDGREGVSSLVLPALPLPRRGCAWSSGEVGAGELFEGLYEVGEVNDVVFAAAQEVLLEDPDLSGGQVAQIHDGGRLLELAWLQQGVLEVSVLQDRGHVDVVALEEGVDGAEQVSLAL